MKTSPVDCRPEPPVRWSKGTLLDYVYALRVLRFSDNHMIEVFWACEGSPKTQEIRMTILSPYWTRTGLTSAVLSAEDLTHAWEAAERVLDNPNMHKDPVRCWVNLCSTR